LIFYSDLERILQKVLIIWNLKKEELREVEQGKVWYAYKELGF